VLKVIMLSVLVAFTEEEVQTITVAFHKIKSSDSEPGWPQLLMLIILRKTPD